MTMKPWTVLVYAVSDNEEYGPILKHLDRLEKAATSPDMRFLCQLDHPNPLGAVRCELKADGIVDQLTSPDLEQLGPTKAASPEALRDFIVWGQQTAPAENTALLLLGPGQGWRCSVRDSDGELTHPQLELALHQAAEQTGQKLAVLGASGLGLSCAELAYQVKDEAGYLVATESGVGVDERLSLLCNPQLWSNLKGAIQPVDLAKSMVEHAPDKADSSAIDLCQMASVGECLRKYSEAIQFGPSNWEFLGDSWYRVDQFHFDHQHDLADLANQIGNDRRVWDKPLLQSCSQLIDAVDSAVVARQADPKAEGHHGLSIEGSRSSKAYCSLALDHYTSWNKASTALRLF